jgi:transcriptional regulator with XRE-family HTH domain
MKILSQIMEEEHQNRIELFKDLFSENLQNIRTEKNYSQKTVAKKLGVPVSTYANWEQGRREPSIYDLFNLMWIYDIDANELFNIDNLI